MTDEAAQPPTRDQLILKLITKSMTGAFDTRLLLDGLIDFMVQRGIAVEDEIVQHLTAYREAHRATFGREELRRISSLLGLDEALPPDVDTSPSP